MGGNVGGKVSHPAPGFVLLYIALLSPHHLSVEINTLITSAGLHCCLFIPVFKFLFEFWD